MDNTFVAETEIILNNKKKTLLRAFLMLNLNAEKNKEIGTFSPHLFFKNFFNFILSFSKNTDD